MVFHCRFTTQWNPQHLFCLTGTDVGRYWAAIVHLFIFIPVHHAAPIRTDGHSSPWEQKYSTPWLLLGCPPSRLDTLLTLMSKLNLSPATGHLGKAVLPRTKPGLDELEPKKQIWGAQHEMLLIFLSLRLRLHLPAEPWRSQPQL